ncbi:CoxG family protein [Paradesulfitobacterium ferrireducens]|uniref:CoxG family protein n=1 Tax=Paradesulfitobacterium ferrireducens TaxID=2816476 RepID=UPI001A8E51F6|nr:SRPBCC domain-containing protein [Paradesulfitobacterium ferrireducens]
MKITNKFLITVPIAEVWDVMFNPFNIGKTFPGCEHVEVIDENTILSLVTVKIECLKARFKLISQIKEQHSPLHIRTDTTWEGQRLIGRVTQTTTLDLHALNDRSTEVAIASELNITGTLANLGRMILRAKIESLTEEWIQSIKALIEELYRPVEKAITVVDTHGWDAGYTDLNRIGD